MERNAPSDLKFTQSSQLKRIVKFIMISIMKRAMSCFIIDLKKGD